MLTASEQSRRKGSESLEGGFGEVNRGSVVTGRAGISDNDIDGVALPGNPDGLAAVRGLGTGVSVDTGIKGGNEVGVGVHGTTSTSDTILGEPSEAESGVRK